MKIKYQNNNLIVLTNSIQCKKIQEKMNLMH